ncbi:hypothetical protein BS47DRAFT_1382832 [Hydnum rufescens UP504]|uniref:Ubiquitin carboxyl-terminal hydrolase n=1 Tax=Hydnum rufescens UP504 TaxID=1448309 RepID=A0A9P6DSZ3_9AGAM|nr:hypothetical protein BS47DRAFT_1382832 [Hydnum rufescens UP504]
MPELKMHSNLSLPELRQEAKRTTQSAVSGGKPSAASLLKIAESTLEEGISSEDSGDLHEAFLRYQQSASFLSHSFNSLDIKQGVQKSRGTRADDPQRLFQLQQNLTQTITQRSAAIERKLQQLDATPNKPKPSPKDNNRAVTPVASSAFPRIFQEWHRTGQKLLLLDVRTREDFDRQHPQFVELVCLEPSILLREGVTSQQIESAIVISPPTEQALFGDRDKFDLVIIMDQSSTTIGPPSSPLSCLVRAIYEQEFSKYLKRPPILLVGGMDAWLQDLGAEHVVFGVKNDITPLFPSTIQYPQPVYSRVMRPSIDYPALLPSTVPSHPPAIASPVQERQDQRSRHHGYLSSLSSALTPPTTPTIATPYPVTSWPDQDIAVSGLKNLGNTCYMNSILQCLSATVPFARFFKDGRWKSAVNMMNPLGSKGHLAQAFSTIVSEMWRQEYIYLSPTMFRKSICLHAPQFNGTHQHDSQEFLSFLLDGLHEDLNRIIIKPEPQFVSPAREAEIETLPQQVASAQEWAIYRLRNDSLIVDYFQGQFRNRLQCLTCEKTSTTYNAFMYLSLPIPTARGNTQVSLYECLDAFVREEIMENTEAWNCPHCKTLRKATKQLSLSRMPPVLLIHLKRFSVAGLFTDKLETPVEYPVKALNLTRYMPPPMSPGSERNHVLKSPPLPATDPRRQEPPYIYDLYGVTNHFGTLSSGHYTACIASKGGWLYCEDSQISPANDRDVVLSRMKRSYNVSRFGYGFAIPTATATTTLSSLTFDPALVAFHALGHI